MITQKYPLNKVNEMAEKYLQAIKTPLPSSIKKWQTFSTIKGDEVKVYNLIMTAIDQGDAAQMHVMKSLGPFSDVDGYSVKTELVFGAKDAFKALGKTL